ncbi:MAG: fasciclin domain-containing protein [Planctomycetota bacterium]
MSRTVIASTCGLLLLSLAMCWAPLASARDNCAAGKKDLVDTAVEAGSFKTLATALGKAGLVEALKGDGPFTVFAPTDEAFAKLPEKTLSELLKPENKGRLASILTYHVVAGNVPAEKALKLLNAKTLNGQQIDLVAKSGELTIDGAKVIKADIQCTNGVIHVIDSVILPSDKSIVATAKDAGVFNTLIAALTAADLATVLQGAGPFTVFAPTDDAFKKLPAGTLENLLRPESRDLLVSILKLHVASGRAFAADALAAEKITTLDKGVVRVRIVDGKPRANEAVIVKTDIDALNGVIHVIDTVLLPREEKQVGAAKARGLIELAILRGAPLFNEGDAEACAAIYEVAASSLLAMELAPSSRMQLTNALTKLPAMRNASDQAWLLRHALDAAHASL